MDEGIASNIASIYLFPNGLWIRVTGSGKLLLYQSDNRPSFVPSIFAWYQHFQRGQQQHELRTCASREICSF